MNAIAEVQTLAADGPDSPGPAMMIALDVDDLTTTDAFVREVAERFKLERKLARPGTAMLLISILGPLSAPAFAAAWAKLVASDEILRGYMELMVVADAMQGTKAGRLVSQASLLADGGDA